MTLTVDIRQNRTSYKRLLKINAARDETMTSTINLLLKLGIDVYLLEDGILEDV